MKNKKILIVIIIFTLSVLLVIFSLKDYFIIKKNNEKIQYSILSQKIDENGTELVLNDVVPFDWDKLYTFEPYTPKEEIENIIGFKSKYICQKIDESMIQLIFIKDNKVIANICDYPDNLSYSLKFYEKGEKNIIENSLESKYNKISKYEKAKFKIYKNKDNNIIYMIRTE